MTNPQTLAQVLFSVTNVPSMNGRLIRLIRRNWPPSMSVVMTSVPISAPTHRPSQSTEDVYQERGVPKRMRRLVSCAIR